MIKDVIEVSITKQKDRNGSPKLKRHCFLHVNRNLLFIIIILCMVHAAIYELTNGLKID